MLRAIYGDSVPAALVPEGEPWQRGDAIRELVRGRIEVSGPITTATLAATLSLPPSDIDLALLALEAEGFVFGELSTREQSKLNGAIAGCSRAFIA